MSNPTAEKCFWHEGDMPLESPGEAGCGNCGMLLATKDCEGCGQTFLDWDFKGTDDVLSGSYVSNAGDLVCLRCCESSEEADEEFEDDDFSYDDVRYGP